MNDILVGKSDQEVWLHAKYANRHGLIAGATGTGKSVSLMLLAEGFSKLGVPVFLADVKGDLAGLSQAGVMSERLQSRLDKLGVEWSPNANPVVFWDIFGKLGHPIRATISEMGPTLLGRLMELNDTQQGVLEVVFRTADDEGLLLLDLKDLRAMLSFASDNAKAISKHYGLVSGASLAAIQRALLSLEESGANHFFGEPALDLVDFMRQDMSGRGIISILAADQLILKPKLYSTFLLWMLSELFENLPEAGDLDKPKLVFFFDEAHLLFDDAPPALVQRIEQVVRLIRSKGVGVFFCSQNPDDVPPAVLGQMANRVQHALRAFTPRDQKAVRAAAETLPPNPKVDVAAAITQLGVGEALVTTLQDGGVPLPVQQTFVASPGCRIGTVSDEERATVRLRSPFGSKYDTLSDRESAFEKLAARQEATAAESEPVVSERGGKAGKAAAEGGGFMSKIRDILLGTRRRQGMLEALAKSAARNAGSQMSRSIMRGVLGGIFKGR
ncbi:helicase HerA-like domain-containing protein [Dokdonella sp.]|uniref:helicase HerA-like domain-containing protein n=1 Tax=Dokdonella sp. TaxID=2291710 RepID=UPI003C5CFD7B